MSDLTAASNGRRLQMWRASGVGPNSALAAVKTVRNRTREQSRNNPWMAAMLDRSVANGIGTGIQCKPIYGDEAFKTADKRLWKRFCKHLDADGILNFEGLQALAWREFDEAGEVFVRRRNRRESDGLPVPLQIQLIESEQCPSDYHGTAPRTGNEIRCGIEFDRIGRRVAYWMYRNHPGDFVGMMAASVGVPIRIPADQISHIYRPLRAGQHRGIPRLSSALVEMFNLHNTRDAVMDRYKIQNLFAGWYTRDANADPASIQLDMGGEAASADDQTPVAGLEPGTMQELPAGVDVKFSTPPAPGTDYAEFSRGSLLAIAAAGGVPYEVLTGDLRNVSDRALRLILNEFRRRIEMDQWVYFIPQFCQPIREAFMDAAVLSGRLQVPGYAELRDEATEVMWVPQGWPYSHPVQDVTADLKAIGGGLQSRDATILANGDDPEQVDAEIKASNDRAAALGLVFEVSTDAGAQPDQNNDPSQE